MHKTQEPVRVDEKCAALLMTRNYLHMEDSAACCWLLHARILGEAVKETFEGFD